MSNQSSLPLVAPKCAPVLDAQFRPAALVTRAFREQVLRSGAAQTVRLAVEQADGSIHPFQTEIFSHAANQHEAN